MGMPLPVSSPLLCICYLGREGYPGKGGFCSRRVLVSVAPGIDIKKKIPWEGLYEREKDYSGKGV